VVYRVWVGKLGGKRLFVRPRHRLGTVKMDLRVTDINGMDQIGLAQYSGGLL